MNTPRRRARQQSLRSPPQTSLSRFVPPCWTCYSLPNICLSLSLEAVLKQFPPFPMHRGAGKFPKVTKPSGRGGGHALLPVEEFLGPPIYSVPQAFRRPLICRQESVRFWSPFAPENVISPAFATI